MPGAEPTPITQYFASIGVREALLLIGATLTAPLAGSVRRRRRLHAMVTAKTGAIAAFSFSSGRGALAAGLRAAGVRPGDDVLVSSYTCLAVPTAVLAIGARPVYCDIDPLTLNATPETIQRSLTPGTRAIVVQHTLGRIAPVGEIVALARDRGLVVIEDCALAIGTTRAGEPVGKVGDAAIYSMELSKTLSTGWGGLLVVNNRQLIPGVESEYAAASELPVGRAARMAIQTAACGVSYLPWAYPLGKYLMHVGYRYGFFRQSTPPGELDGQVAADFVAKLPGPQAVLGAHQWSRLEVVASACERNGRATREVLERLGYLPLGSPPAGDFAVSPRVSFLVHDRDAALRWFADAGVYLGTWFDGPLSPPPTSVRFNYDASLFPRAAMIARHVINLPSHSRLTAADLDRMAHLVETYLSTHPEDLELQKLVHFPAAGASPITLKQPAELRSGHSA